MADTPRAVLERTGTSADATLVDRDENAINELQQRFRRQRHDLRQQDFLSASRELMATGEQFDLILADLGVSSPHLNEPTAVLPSADGPLDMRMDQTQTLTAETIVNTSQRSSLAEILRRYGEEPKASRLLRLIVAARPLHDNR